MARSWEMVIWETILISTVIGLLTLVVFVLSLPTTYNPYRADLIEESNFSEEDKKNNESGYGYFAKHRGTDKSLKSETSVTVLVLGDIGRSPRMQYHVASIAKHGGKVSLIGYVESEILPEVATNRFVRIIPLKPVPERLRSSTTLTFPFIAPLKVLFQLWSIWRACGYQTKPTKWMLVQNPPSIPTLLIAQAICAVRNTRLIIDWHNFGYTILALKLGDNHPLVKISKIYEQYVARWADAHFCVTNAMARVLKQNYGVEALPLHDRPAKQFQPLTSVQRSEVLHRLEGTKAHAEEIESKKCRLVVSSTSWTADEDFSLLLEAFVAYSATVAMDRRYPKILAIITGKGPHKEYYLKQIEKLENKKRLSNIIIKTAWLSLEDYASLLGAADVGVSLHKSSSGVDLPMKVVDMFGTGLPVFGYSKFEAWPELVQDGVNGMGFDTAEELETLFEKAFTGNGGRLDKLRAGAEKETKRRWDDEWFPVAGKLLKMSGTTLESDPRPQTKDEPLTYSFAKKTEEAPTEEGAKLSHETGSRETAAVAATERLPEGPLHVESNISDKSAGVEADAPVQHAPAHNAPAQQDSAQQVPAQHAKAPSVTEIKEEEAAAAQTTTDHVLGEGKHVNEGFVDVVNATPFADLKEQPQYPVSSESTHEPLFPRTSENTTTEGHSGGTYLSYAAMRKE